MISGSVSNDYSATLASSRPTQRLSCSGLVANSGSAFPTALIGAASTAAPGFLRPHKSPPRPPARPPAARRAARGARPALCALPRLQPPRERYRPGRRPLGEREALPLPDPARAVTRAPREAGRGARRAPTEDALLRRYGDDRPIARRAHRAPVRPRTATAPTSGAVPWGSRSSGTLSEPRRPGARRAGPPAQALGKPKRGPRRPRKPRRPGHRVSPVETTHDSPPPLGRAAAPDLRGRPPTLPQLCRSDEDDRFHPRSRRGARHPRVSRSANRGTIHPAQPRPARRTKPLGGLVVMRRTTRLG